MEARHGERADEEVANELAVVDVEPFRAGDEGADVSGLSVECGRQEEVGVQTGELARLHAHL